jgi:nitrogen fixation/metabolism regulation signal transduction histidine kinase
MYFSLNKKIFYTLFLILILMAILFLTMFQNIYGERYADDQQMLVARNRYIVDLLHENITLRRELNNFRHTGQDTEDLLAQKEEELQREKNVSENLRDIYNQRWSTFTDGSKIIGLSSLLSLLLILILGFLLQRWVIGPVQELAAISREIASGHYSKRVCLSRKGLVDELDTLAADFNIMIDNIEHNISEIQSTDMFLQSMIDAIPDGIRVIDHDYNIILVNKAYARHTGDHEQTKCYRAYGCAYPCPQGLVTCPLRKMKSAGSGNFSMVHQVNNRPLGINAAPLKIKGSDGKDKHYIVEIMRDLSEDIRFSHEQKIASLGFLATSVAHEMKNNLGAIRMILEGLIEQKDDILVSAQEREKYLQMIYRQVVSAVNLPERLLRLARQNPDDNEQIDLNADVTEVLSLLDYEAKRNGITVTLDNQDTDLQIMGNSVDFKMIVLNLAQNAFKAMPAGGQFHVTVTKNRNYAIIELKDSGTGIPPEKIPHIFEPFYSDGHHTRHKGTGLGLAIVKSLIEKLKGQISVTSRVNVGTTFEIKIPRAKRNNLHS